MCEGRCCLSIASVCIALSLYILLGATAFFFLETDHGAGAGGGATMRELSVPRYAHGAHGWTAAAAAAAAAGTGVIGGTAVELESIRNSTVQRLWVLTLELNVFYESNWTSLAELELQRFQDDILRFVLRTTGGGDGDGDKDGVTWGGGGSMRPELDRDRDALHNFPAALLYSLTLITTIGYGSVSPRSLSGRILTVVYACVGIPLTLCYLATVGDYLARCFRAMYAKITGQPRGRREGGASVGVPIPLSLLLLLLYLAGGAGVFWWLEGWSFIDALFFCFASLATIGFGGMLDPHSKHISLLVSSLYILLGMALISTVFNLVQDEIVRRRSERSSRYHRPIS